MLGEVLLKIDSDPDFPLWPNDPVAGTIETCNLATHANTRKRAFDLLTPVGLSLC